MRPASRRSWCIGQTEPVRVVFMAYRNTPALSRHELAGVGRQSSLAEGELPDNSLAAAGMTGRPDAGARQEDRRGRGGRLGRVGVEQARQVAAEALLVDAEWAAPEPIAAETVTVGPGRADDHSDRTPEPQRFLFSWAGVQRRPLP